MSGRALPLFALCVLLQLSVASTTYAQTTALFIDSQPGDPVGGGQSRTWTASDAVFSVLWFAENSIQLAVTNRPGATPVAIGLRFFSPTGASFAPGIYEYGFLEISYKTACNRTVGRFQIHEISFSPTFRFAADFEQHCEDIGPALFGAIRINSTRSSLVPFDGAYPVYAVRIESAPNGYVTGPGIDCGAGRLDCSEPFAPYSQIALRATPSPGYVFLGWGGIDCVGADEVIVQVRRLMLCTPVFNRAPGTPGGESPDYSDSAFYLDGDLGAVEGGVPPRTRVRRVYVSPAARVWYSGGNPLNGISFTISSQTSSKTGLTRTGWSIGFYAPPGKSLTPGIYQPTEVYPGYRADAPLLGLAADGVTCSWGGHFEVYEFEYDGSSLVRFAADFELPCGADGRPISGSIRYHSTRSSLLPFDGEYPAYELEIVPTLGGYVLGDGIDCGDGGRSDCRERYSSPSVVGLRAVPSPGYDFIGWTESCSDANLDTAVFVEQARRCGAVFNPSAAASAPPDARLGVATLFIDAPGSTIPPARRLWIHPDTTVTSVSHRSALTGEVFISLEFRSRSLGLERVFFHLPAGRPPVGVYDEAHGGERGFPVFSVSRCHGKVDGRFTVYEIRFDSADSVTSFAADFEARCTGDDDSPEYVVGAVRFNSSRADIRPFGGAYPVYQLTIDRPPNGRVTGPGIDCGPGNHASCTATYANPTVAELHATPAGGYRFVGWGGSCADGETTTVNVNWIRRCYAVFNATIPGVGVEDPRVARASLLVDGEPGAPMVGGHRRILLDLDVRLYSTRNHVHLSLNPYVGPWFLTFQAPEGQELRAEEYRNTVYSRLTSPNSPALSVVSAGSCPSGPPTGSFVVHEIVFESPMSGTVVSFAADFEYRCGPGTPALRGAVRYNSTRSTLTPFAPVVTPSLAASSDIDGDGWPDLVWRHRTTGRNALWFMNGTKLRSTVSLTPQAAATVSDTNWEIRAVADFNGDAQPDLIWQHKTNGRLAVWFMSGASLVSVSGFATLSGMSVETELDWKIVGAGDLNRDSQTDLFWRHQTSGALRVWHMNGVEQWDSVELSNVVTDVRWEIAGLSDMNGDGWLDLVWRHYGHGGLAAWFLNDTTLVQATRLTPSTSTDLNWHVVGVADVNRDGQTDLLWQHYADGRLGVWYMNGVELVSAALLERDVSSNVDWRIVGVK